MAGQEKSIADAAVEVVEEQVDVVVKSASLFSRIIWNHKTHILTTAVVMGGVGAYAGYRYAVSKLTPEYEALLAEQTEHAKTFYTKLGKTQSPEELLLERHGEKVESEESDEAVALMKSYMGMKAETPAESEEELSTEEQALYVKNGVDPRPPVEEIAEVQIRRNVFDGVEAFDYDREVPQRTETAPYVISREEYYGSESEYEQTDLTWYEGDEVLVDSRDEPIPEPDKIVGEDNLVKFGYGSEDKDVVFVRNDVIEVEFEITRSFGKFSVDVLGFTDDEPESSMKHTAVRPGRRKFRDQDD